MEQDALSNVRDVILFGDTHCGCQLALTLRDGAALDNGGKVMPSSEMQQKIAQFWDEAWDWAYERVAGRPFVAVHMGDGIEGVHHNATTPMTWNITDQIKLAEAVIKPKIQPAAAYYHIRGTPAHAGVDGQHEEELACRLEAVPNKYGNHARKSLWKRLGPRLMQCSHAIGVTSAAAYELGALNRLAVSYIVEGARRDVAIPDILVRGHRHRSAHVSLTMRERAMHVIVTPCWQAKSLYVHKNAGSQACVPEFGLAHVRVNPDEGDEITVSMWRRYVEEDDIE